MTSRILKILAILAVATLVTGCKLAVMVPSGGDVTSGSGTRNCAGGSLCEHNITDSTFNESFTAVARPGYVFTQWNSGSGFFCGNSTNPTCTISNVGTAENVAIEDIIASGQFFYAMPRFAFVGIDTDGDGVKDHIDKDDDNDGVDDEFDSCPLEGPNSNGYGCPYPLITDTISANGKVWAQVDLFTNLSWSDINAVCPEGICQAGGVLNGHDMTGWTWASAGDMRELFNSYGVDPPLSPSQNFVVHWSNVQTTWAPAFFDDGWRKSYIDGNHLGQGTTGLTREAASCTPACYGQEAALYDGLYEYDMVKVLSVNDSDGSGKSSHLGAWFYRTP